MGSGKGFVMTVYEEEEKKEVVMKPVDQRRCGYGIIY